MITLLANSRNKKRKEQDPNTNFCYKTRIAGNFGPLIILWPGTHVLLFLEMTLNPLTPRVHNDDM